MKDRRPVNLDISTMKLPITAWASISHRVSGVLMIPLFASLLWMLQVSLHSESSFQVLKQTLSNPVIKMAVWLGLMGYVYHLLAGVKHLIMDLGYGETFEGGVVGAKLLFLLTGIIFILTGFWLW